MRPSRFSAGPRPGIASNGADLRVGFLYGRDFYNTPIRSFIATEIGYRKRFSLSADQIEMQATVGLKPAKRFFVLVDGFSNISMRNEKIGGADYDLYKVQPSVVWQLRKRWALQAGVTQEIAGRNIDTGRTYFLGLWAQY